MEKNISSIKAYHQHVQWNFHLRKHNLTIVRPSVVNLQEARKLANRFIFLIIMYKIQRQVSIHHVKSHAIKFPLFDHLQRLFQNVFFTEDTYVFELGIFFQHKLNYTAFSPTLDVHSRQNNPQLTSVLFIPFLSIKAKHFKS